MSLVQTLLEYAARLVGQHQSVGQDMAKKPPITRHPVQIGRHKMVVSTISLLWVSRKTARMRGE